MKELFKNLLYLLCVAFALGITGCSDKNDDEEEKELPTYLQAVNELIRSGGAMEVIEEHSNITVVKMDTAENIVTIPNGKTQENYYPIKVTKDLDVNTNPHEFVLYNPWTDVIWPGALIQGGSLKNNNVPASVPIYKKRLPGKIFLGIVSGNEDMDDWYKETELSPANVNTAMNELLKTYLGKMTPAYTSYKVESVQSIEEMALKLGIDLKLFGGKLKTDFGHTWSKEKNYAVVSLRHTFFTMAYNGPDGGLSGVFTDDITVDDLKNFTGAGNPLCYVSSVTYGRVYTLLYESSHESDSLKKALTIAYGEDNKTENTSMSRKVINESTCTMTQIGGDPKAGLEATFGDFDKIKAFAVDGAKVSVDNVGAPISFKINLVHDNTLVQLSNTLKYSVTEQIFTPVIPHNNVEINLFDFVMQAPDPDRGFTVSNHSQFQVKSIKAGHSRTGQLDVGSKITTFENFKTSILPLKNGLNVPIYQTVFFNDVPKDHIFRIECEVYVKSQSYRASTYKGEETYKLIQFFEFKKDKNAWEPIEKNLISPFESLSLRNKKLSRTAINFDLNFRFKCDDFVYPLNQYPLNQ